MGGVQGRARVEATRAARLAELGSRRSRPGARRPARPRPRRAPRPSPGPAARCPRGGPARGRGPRARRSRARPPSQSAVGAVDRVAVGDLDVLEHLRQALASAAPRRARCRRAPRSDEQRRGDPVAGGRELGPDDVAGLLAAERPARGSRAPPRRGGRRPASSPPRSPPRPSPGGSRSCSSRSPRRRRRARPRSREVAARRSRSARRRRGPRRPSRPRPPGRRRRRRRSRSSAPAARTRSASASGWVEPQPSLMLRPSGSVADRLDLGAEALEDRGAAR